MIEQCFGILKNSYTAAGTLRYRNRRWTGPIVCHITAALFNRKKMIYKMIRDVTGLRFMR